MRVTMWGRPYKKCVGEVNCANGKSLLINGENPEVGNPQQGESQLQRLNEETPKGEATVRPRNITKRNP